MNPYIDTINNVLMNINEAMLIVIGVFFFIFAEPDTNDNRLLILGWCVIGVIVLVMVMNILVIWTLKIKMIKKEILEW